jgi:threonine dehydratase
MQVPAAERAEWIEALADIGYPFSDETDNPAYRTFLG